MLDGKNKILCSIIKFIIFLLFCSLTTLEAANVEVFGREIYVDAEPFVFRGVCYSPTPIGQNVASGYRFWQDRNYVDDIPKIKSLGANVIRIYDAPQNYNANFEEFLYLCYKNKIYVIVGYWVNQDFSSSTVRQQEKENFLKIVNLWKNYTAVLGWCFGNEVYPSGGSSWSDWYSLLEEVTEEVKKVTPNLLMMTATNVGYFYGTAGKKENKSDDISLAKIDCWGINVYWGATFKDLFENYANITNKPLLITEFGCDSWDRTKDQEDEEMQKDYIISQWRDIERNLTIKGGVVSGGFVFEWSDEWWKNSSSSPSVHDTTSDWENSNYEDKNMNEEWFGIMKISSDTSHNYITQPKVVYYALQNLWKKFVNVEKNIIYAYPNPAKNVEFVKFNLPYDSDEIKIYTISGELVRSIKIFDVFNTRWYLDNNYYKNVASGIYIFVVKTKNGETYRGKIVVVR
jgi:beta-glucuronidase